MAIKQPRVPEYRESEGMEAYIRRLILFLKDYCQESWMESRKQGKAIETLMQAAAKQESNGTGEDGTAQAP